MDQSDLDTLRALLESERDRILSRVQQTQKRGLELSSDELSDENDLASARYEQGFDLRMRGRERMLLLKIKNALERVVEGEHGYCEVCDDEIGLERLMARPVTTMCIECKEEAERAELPRPAREEREFFG